VGGEARGSRLLTSDEPRIPGRSRRAQRLGRVMNNLVTRAPWTWRLVRGPMTRARVLDVGTGTGAAALIAAERWPEPPLFAPVSGLLRSGGFVAHIASRGPTTHFYTSAQKLAEGFERHGLETVASGAAGPGTYYLARRP
jgi:hypothetical protein